MTNIEKIKFEAKYSLKYMNGLYMLSGFDHTISLRISEEKISEVLESGLGNFTQGEWDDFVSDHTED